MPKNRSRRPPPPADPFPAEFRARMEGLLGGESEAFFEALAEPPVGLRVNTLKVTPERLREGVPFALEPLAFPPEGFRVAEEGRPGKHPFHAAGLFYLQDPGAMAVGALVDPRPGERVIDLAAAPGGKTTHLAARMGGEGVLVANDVHPGRTRELMGNLERCGVRNAMVTLEPVERLADAFGAWFDRVLLDAPCSGEAMFHKSGAARAGWSPAAVEGCAVRQEALLAEAARLVRAGGLLAYSTCTFSPEEDEAVIGRFLRDHPGWEVEAAAPVPGSAPGRPEWVAEAIRDPALARTVRLWPHRLAGAGHFVALLRRTGETPEAPAPRPGGDVPRQAREMLEGFLAASLPGARLGPGALEMRGQELFLLPPGLPPLPRLRVERPGWWLGTVHRDRFEPAHALALGLAPGEVAEPVALTADDPATLRYLRGETLPEAGAAGWRVVTVDGFPLGWGKRVADTVKNHYPKGLRWV